MKKYFLLSCCAFFGIFVYFIIWIFLPYVQNISKERESIYARFETVQEFAFTNEENFDIFSGRILKDKELNNCVLYIWSSGGPAITKYDCPKGEE